MSARPAIAKPSGIGLKPNAPIPANGADTISTRQWALRLKTAGRRCNFGSIAIYLFTTSRHGVPAKELERQLGVTYKTAWRMADLIRNHMATVDDEWPLFGNVESDETYVGGRTHGVRGRGAANKTIVFGMMQRKGQVMTKVVPNVAKKTLQPIIEENVLDGATVHTDELKSYKGLKKAASITRL